MNKKPLMLAVAALCMALGSTAFAQNHDRRGDQSNHNQRGHDQAHRGGHGSAHAPAARPDIHRHAPARMHESRRGAGPRHDMHRGQRLPTYYRGRQYVVNDWRSHRLSQPPRGHHWVQTGGDYVLVAIGSGLIVQLMLH